jgi:uracil phosphoribosyltransferase
MPTARHPNFHLLNQPLARAMVTQLRLWNTPKEVFRKLVADLSLILFIEMSRRLTTRVIEVDTPLQKTKGFQIKENIVLVPILRAGLGMLASIENFVPGAAVGHLGIYRDEKTLQPHHYYAKLPTDLSQASVYILDPMLATGHSAITAVDEVKKRGARYIQLGCLIAAPEGVKALSKHHPKVEIYAAALDRKLNAKGFILPGLGDAGDRLFGT